ncbi:uncharacterized protein MONOS_4961 [Monocercomonoides exilis]|uniref:uncharacterized protein n=1 Tax=Monocercomonoides exilis TaxID=2049356 RepID=UPI0035597941|nr:hypothetical protein MONOS_4961 [Monocercomonoides exilis]
MSLSGDDNSEERVQLLTITEKFSKLLHELEGCREDEQKQKIEEMNGLIDEMNKEEFKSVFTKELFDTIGKMIEKKTLTCGNAILLLKHVGYCIAIKNIWIYSSKTSSMDDRFEKMIAIENKKKSEEKDENLLTDLCECCVFLNGWISLESISICVPYLFKEASKKEENEETQKDVEIALLALSNIGFQNLEQKVHLKEITEIIEHQQKHRNLSKLAFQSAWQFLIYRFYTNGFLEDTVVNELHFGREAAREQEELIRNVNWKKKEEKMNKEEANKVLIIRRWIGTISIYLLRCKLWNEEYVGLINSIVQEYQAAKDNYRGICNQCIYSLRNAAENRAVKVDDLLKGGAINTVLEEMQQRTLKDKMARENLHFFLSVSERLKEEKKDEKEEAERKKTKRKVFEWMEEEGYEDHIISFCEAIPFFSRKFHHSLSFDVSDYFVNILRNETSMNLSLN